MINWTAVIITLIICLTILAMSALSKEDKKKNEWTEIRMDRDVYDWLEEKKNE